eukprot:1316929-Pleurochrysis_carterae.AAC.3
MLSSSDEELVFDDDGPDPLSSYADQTEEAADPLFSLPSLGEQMAALSLTGTSSANETTTPRCGAAPLRVGKITGVTDRPSLYKRKVDDESELLEKPPAMRLSHGQYAWEHKTRVGSFLLGKPCKPSCPFDG